MPPYLTVFEPIPMSYINIVILFGPLCIGCAYYLYKVFSIYVLGNRIDWVLSRKTPMRFYMGCASVIAFLSLAGPFVLLQFIGGILLILTPAFTGDRFHELR